VNVNERASGSVNTSGTRRSSRVSARPHRYNNSDYDSALFTLDAEYELCMGVHDEPLTYQDAIKSEHKEEWIKAMLDEWQSLIDNGTWTEVDRTDDMNVVGVKWVFKVKKNEDGVITRYKARMVAKGYTQEYGIDYHETFAPVLKYKTLRIILALSVGVDVCIEQMDVKTAFLNADVHEDIYVLVPDGMKLKVGNGKVLKLKKALYGIKQAPHEWNKNINAFLLSIGFRRCLMDTCLYIKISRSGKMIIIGLFVDDITVSYHKCDLEEWMSMKVLMKLKYKLSDMGDIHHVVGMRVKKREDGTVWIDQATYIDEKLREFGMDQCKPMSTPETITRNSENDDELSEEDMSLYRQMVGSLIYASTSTRPDIAHAVNVATRHMRQARHSDMVNMKRTLRYLCGTKEYGLHYRGVLGDVMKIEAYSDSDWGGDREDRKSTSGYVVLVNGNVVSWCVKKQRVVAMSTAEAEWIALNECVREVVWIVQLMGELGVKVQQPVTVYEDNQSTIKICENDVMHDAMKHVAMAYHWVREQVKEKKIELQWVASHDQLADIFTKSLGRVAFERIRNVLMAEYVAKQKDKNNLDGGQKNLDGGIHQ
jgi:hypothetical protein